MTIYHDIFLKKSLQNLRESKNIIIQKSDKGHSVVIVDKTDCLDKMENLLNDTRKFEKIILKNDGILNFAVNQEKRVDNILKKLVPPNAVSEETRRSLQPVGITLDIMYGLCKVHKDFIVIAHFFDLYCKHLILLPIN